MSSRLVSVILSAGILGSLASEAHSAEWQVKAAPVQYRESGPWNYGRYPYYGRYSDYDRRSPYVGRQSYRTYGNDRRYDGYVRYSDFRRYGGNGPYRYAQGHPYERRYRTAWGPYAYRGGYQSYRPYGPGRQSPGAY